MTTYETYKRNLQALTDLMDTDFMYDDACKAIYKARTSAPAKMLLPIAIADGRKIQAAENKVEEKFNRTYLEWRANNMQLS